MSALLWRTVALMLQAALDDAEVIEDIVAQAFEQFLPSSKGGPKTRAGTWADALQAIKASKVALDKALLARFTACVAPLLDQAVSAPALIRVLKGCLPEGSAAAAASSHHHMHVVPGSGRLNTLAGVKSYQLKAVTAGSMKRLRAVFDDMDSEGDGTFSLQQWRTYVTAMRPEFDVHASKVFKLLDEDRDGRVSFRQLLVKLYPQASAADISALVALSQSRRARPRHGLADPELFAELAKVFAIFDTEEAGGLERDEFVEALQQAGFSEEEAAAAWPVCNVEQRGIASLDDFKVYYMVDAACKVALLRRMEGRGGAGEEQTAGCAYRGPCAAARVTH